MSQAILYLLIVATICAAVWTAYLVLMNAAFNAGADLLTEPSCLLPWAGVAVLGLIYFTVL